jgi:hypothetical protein
MSIKQDLLELEKKFWTGDGAFYRQNLDDQCLVAFTEMSGVMSKDDIAGMIDKDQQRWSDLQLREKGFVEPAEGVALLSYEASARRGSGQAYKAVVTSGYVKRDGRWKMAFHQQTPLDAAKAA